MTTLEDAKAICEKLPGAVRGDGRFGFGVKVKGKGKVKGFCWTWMERVHPKRPKEENPGVLAILTPGLAAKETIMSSEPEKYVVDPHYRGFPAVLVRLAAIKRGELEDLLIEAWRTKVPKAVVAAYDASID